MTSQQPEAWPFRWQRNHYFHSWFSWIEWLGLTAALITATLKANNLILQIPIGALAALSIIFIYFSGLAGLSTFLGSSLAKIGMSRKIHLLVAVITSFFVTLSLLWSLVSVLMVLISDGS